MQTISNRQAAAQMPEKQLTELYEALLDSWNGKDAARFAALFRSDGYAVGFDGSQMSGPEEIQASLAAIFNDHEVATYVGIVKEVRSLSTDIFLLKAVAG